MVTYDSLSDDDLLALLKEHDHHAYAEIYKRYWSILYRYSRKILQNEEESRDVIQDVFVMVWSKSSTLDLHTSLSSFLYASVRNSILKSFERGKVREKYMNSLEKFIDEGTDITDHLVRNRELAGHIEKEIAKLPSKMREVFELSRKVNLSHKEIAFKMEISDKTVKKQMSNAIKILRLKLGPLAGILLFFYL
ncbi:RNA polymerase sigma 70 [Pedobacter lusitanus]|uniref:RNA polymerase sigma 70 n=1 Tax=Pedobacter lusitanus TaxID=1503925 RepID=A0A0D0GPT4_9SPHI|nr:RNA polymerase sigma-70 factor [Pedobacter lusitanus]KIO78195.1 RNA polymerase sigma 70 [Pedobacter lusitanus]